MRIIAIDPGFDRIGVAVMEKISSKEVVVFSTCILTNKNETHGQRLLQMGKEIKKIIETFKPEALAIEELFLGKNQKTVMKVSEARGVLIYEGATQNLPIFEYTPLQVKIAVTGQGRSDKTQVIQMLKKMVKIDTNIKYDDEFDAIAIGITHLNMAKY